MCFSSKHCTIAIYVRHFWHSAASYEYAVHGGQLSESHPSSPTPFPLAICGLPRILEKDIDHHGYCSLISIAPTKFTSLYYGVSMTPLPLTNLYLHYA